MNWIVYYNEDIIRQKIKSPIHRNQLIVIEDTVILLNVEIDDIVGCFSVDRNGFIPINYIVDGDYNNVTIAIIKIYDMIKRKINYVFVVNIKALWHLE